METVRGIIERGYVYSVYGNSSGGSLAGFDWAKAIVIAVIAGALISLIVNLIRKRRHKSVSSKSEANTYIVEGSFHLTASSDRFLFSEVFKQRRQRDINRGGPQGPRGGFGGGFGGGARRF